MKTMCKKLWIHWCHSLGFPTADIEIEIPVKGIWEVISGNMGESHREGWAGKHLSICLSAWLHTHMYSHLHNYRVSSGGSVVKNTPANAGNARDLGLIPGSGRSPGKGNGNPLQYSCLENPMDRGAWWAAVHEVPKSWTRQSDWAHVIKI